MRQYWKLIREKERERERARETGERVKEGIKEKDERKGRESMRVIDIGREKERSFYTYRKKSIMFCFFSIFYKTSNF